MLVALGDQLVPDRSFGPLAPYVAEVIQDQQVIAIELGQFLRDPKDQPSPSGTDLRNCLDITVPRPEPMVFLILGRRPDWLGVSLCVEVTRFFPATQGADRRRGHTQDR